MDKSIYLVGGSKGGVGKTMVSMALVDYLINRGNAIALVECDTANPDMYKAYKDIVQVELINLDEHDGWIQLVNLCDAEPNKDIIINTAARSNEGIAAYGSILLNALEELGRKLCAMWVINRQRDSVELLRRYMQAMPGSIIHVVKNGHFGPEKKFELYDNSNVRKEVDGIGGGSLMFPDLADRVADDLYIKRLSIQEAAKQLPLGNRAELQRWREEVRKCFDGVIAATRTDAEHELVENEHSI
jgi:hypothetical protein